LCWSKIVLPFDGKNAFSKRATESCFLKPTGNTEDARGHAAGRRAALNQWTVRAWRGEQGELHALILQASLCLLAAHVGSTELVAQVAARVAGVGHINDSLVQLLSPAEQTGLVVTLSPMLRT
jgi:hypothetical protein